MAYKSDAGITSFDKIFGKKVMQQNMFGDVDTPFKDLNIRDVRSKAANWKRKKSMSLEGKI